jgi:hypothetical protein
MPRCHLRRVLALLLLSYGCCAARGAVSVQPYSAEPQAKAPADTSCWVAGAVQDAAGAPVAGARVTLSLDGVVKGTMVSDATGRYEFRGLEAGMYVLTVARAGFARTSTAPFVVGPKMWAKDVTLQAVAGTKVEASVGAETHQRLPAHTGGEDGSPRPEGVATEKDPAQKWMDQLPKGALTHHVDPTMRLTQPSTVTVTIFGNEAAKTAEAQGGQALQVSPMMEVTLTQPDNPGAFTIVDGDSKQNPRRVVSGAKTTWTWQVTPLRLGELHLKIDAYVLYQGNEDNRVELQSFSDDVKVQSMTAGGYLQQGWTWMLENPAAVFRYLLPGGGGAALLATIFAWWRKRKKPEAGGADKGA